MNIFRLPAWINPHLYPQKKFNDLTSAEIEELKGRLQKFSSDSPDVSVMIPAWNEENNIFRTLSSLASNETELKVEIVVINNNSTDNTQKVLDELGVKNYLQPLQGTPYARQLGLTMAKGKYHLCADSDSFYPKKWIDLMCKPLMADDNVVGVYGRYSFVPPAHGDNRFSWFIYEKITGLLVRLRKRKREHINFLGFNMGFITAVGLNNGGFIVKEVRKFDNAIGSDYFVDEAEDGRMAVNLKKTGQLSLVTDPRARVYTSTRRIVAEGGLFTAFKNRLLLHSGRFKEYFKGKEVD